MAWGQSWSTFWGSAWGDAELPPIITPNQNAWGDSWNGFWGDAWGGATPTYTPANVTVRTFRVMYFGGKIQEINAQFVITSPYQFTPYGMTLVSTPPADWNTLMESYSETSDKDRIRMPGRDENRIPSRASRVVPIEPGNPYD